MNAVPDLTPMLAALPPAQRQRLLTMGLPGDARVLREPDRALRRAIGAPLQIGLVDLELDPERWHGCYVATFGTVGWSQDTKSLGRLWLNPTLALLQSGRGAESYPAVFPARITGILLADAQIRAEHRSRHHSPGGYGHFGLFVAELVAASIHVEAPPPPSKSRPH